MRFLAPCFAVYYSYTLYHFFIKYLATYKIVDWNKYF